MEERGTGICIHLKGALCAENYCDYYDDWEQKCSLAVESHRRADIMTKILEHLDNVLADAKDPKSIVKIMEDINSIFTSKTIH